MATPPRLPDPARSDDDDATDDFDERFASERVTQRSRPWVGYVATFLAASYAVLGVVVLLVPPARFPLPTTWRIVFGVVLIAYGLLRVWRAIKRYYR